jgi:hypothetical protein
MIDAETVTLSLAPTVHAALLTALDDVSEDDLSTRGQYLLRNLRDETHAAPARQIVWSQRSDRLTSINLRLTREELRFAAETFPEVMAHAEWAP